MALIVLWFALSFIKLAYPDSVIVYILSLLTFAQGGMYGGILGAVGGILGKALFASFIVTLTCGLGGVKRQINSILDGFKVRNITCLGALIAGTGFGLILSNFMTGNMMPENSIICITSGIACLRKLKMPNNNTIGFLNSFVKGKPKNPGAAPNTVAGASIGFFLAFVMCLTLHFWFSGYLLGAILLVIGNILFFVKSRQKPMTEQIVAVMLLFIIILVPFISSTPVSAASESEGYWKLTGSETTPFKNDNPPNDVKIDATVSGNTFSYYYKYTGSGTGFYTDDHNSCTGEYFEYKAIFSTPPKKLYAGETLTVKLDVSCSYSKPFCFFIGSNADARFGLPNQLPGTVNVYDNIMISEDGISSLLSANDKITSHSLTLTLEVPTGSKDLEKTLYYNSSGMQVEYKYIWVSTPESSKLSDSDDEFNTKPTEPDDNSKPIDTDDEPESNSSDNKSKLNDSDDSDSTYHTWHTHTDPAETAVVGVLTTIVTILVTIFSTSPGSFPGGISDEGVQDLTAPYAEPESMVVQITPEGAEILLVRDPETGEWINSETGNLFDLDAHQKNYPKQVKEYEAWRDYNNELGRTGKTAMDEKFAEIDRESQKRFDDIQQEINKRIRDDLAQMQEHLEWEREHANELNNWRRATGDAFIGSVDEIKETAGKIADEAAIIGEGVKMTISDVFTDPDQVLKNVKDGFGSVKDKLDDISYDVAVKIEEVIEKPWIVVDKVMQTGKNVVDTVTDPKKLWEFAKDSTGISDYQKSLDPNLPLSKRLIASISGVTKLGGTIITAGQTGTMIKSGVGKLSGFTDDILKGGAGKTVAKIPVKPVIKVPKKTIGTSAKVPVRSGTSYCNRGTMDNIPGVTKGSQKYIQSIADEFGVSIKVRPTTATAQKWLDAKKAVPKPMAIKAKTLNPIDELIGGPKNSEGLVGYFKPEMPPESIIKTLSNNLQKDIKDRYCARMNEYNNLACKMQNYKRTGEYQVVDGVVFNKKGMRLTGDVDLFDITNFDGTKLENPKIKQQVLDRLTLSKNQSISNVMHEDVISWDETGIDFCKSAKDKMLDAASKENEGLISFNPMNEPTKQLYNQTGGKA